jgi:hypothetical protein
MITLPQYKGIIWCPANIGAVELFSLTDTDNPNSLKGLTEDQTGSKSVTVCAYTPFRKGTRAPAARGGQVRFLNGSGARRKGLKNSIASG